MTKLNFNETKILIESLPAGFDLMIGNGAINDMCNLCRLMKYNKGKNLQYKWTNSYFINNLIVLLIVSRNNPESISLRFSFQKYLREFELLYDTNLLERDLESNLCYNLVESDYEEE